MRRRCDEVLPEVQVAGRLLALWEAAVNEVVVDHWSIVTPSCEPAHGDAVAVEQQAGLVLGDVDV